MNVLLQEFEKRVVSAESGEIRPSPPTS